MDVTLAEVALWYMRKKKMKMTTGNLFWIMEKICRRLEQINKNANGKIVSFTKGHCELKV